MDKIFDSKDTLFVTRSSGKDMVVMSKNDYEGMQETLHLLSSPKNAQRLKEAIEEYNSGGGQPRQLIEN